jgi:opacity protein-like surface antigen
MRSILAMLGVGCGLGLVSLGIGSAAHAADLAPQPIYKAPAVVTEPYFPWAGLYVGVHVGYGTGHVNRTSSGAVTDTSYDQHGWLGGGQVGYNVVFSQHYLIGLEGDVSGADINGQFNSATAITNSRDRLLATARARAGFLATNTVLLYATGGGAYHDVSSSRTALVVTNGVPAGTVESTSHTDWGWTAGSGVEWGFMPHWTAKAEYLYFQFDHSNTTPLTQISNSATDHLHTFRLGVNFLFN